LFSFILVTDAFLAGKRLFQVTNSDILSLLTRDK